MTATPALTAALQQQVRTLVEDFRERVDENPELRGKWEQEHRRANEKERTAASWVEWRDDRIDQAAVAWVLTSVFIRFCEDNALVKPVWITGPGKRRQEALDAQREFFQKHPESTDREWLLDAIDYLGSLPSTKPLVDTHSALHWVSPSGGAVTELLKLWRGRSDDGTYVHDLHDESLSTRFLGDLYQELSAHAKDKYALLQTPVFVEEFILNRTLEPALDERLLEGFRMIDPTCGSGHFLLGSFHKLLDRWHRHAPNLEIQARVQSALDAIHGVDLNPFAVAIARFRLTVAALNACGLRSLEEAPAFKYHLAVGDSLIHGPDSDVLPGMEERGAYMPFHYATEDAQLLMEILEEGRYDAVVGNPPYIQPSDRALNKIYRSKFGKTCKGTYALTVPFMVQLFRLAKRGEQSGWIGMITSNSFMKREFGVNLIKDFFPKVDLRLVIDSEGAWIPGHNSDGTPTVIIVGRRRSAEDPTVRAVLSKGMRENRSHGSNGEGPYWTSLTEHWDEPGWDNEWIAVADLKREALSSHPWNLAGGSIGAALAAISAGSECALKSQTTRIGFFGDSHADEAFFLDSSFVARLDLPINYSMETVRGSEVRNWVATPGGRAIFPYDKRHELVSLEDLGLKCRRYLWSLRSILGNRSTFSGATYFADSRPWYSWHQLPKDRSAHAWSIVFAEIASHSHFSVAGKDIIFNRTAPIIKLPGTSTEDSHFGIAGSLNSSVGCFWLRQMCKPKGGAAGLTWSRTYQFNGKKLAEFPLPPKLPAIRARILAEMAETLLENSPEKIFSRQVPSVDALANARRSSEDISGRMISVQEELDWEIYKTYGLTKEDLTYGEADLPRLAPGERAFELALSADVNAEGILEWLDEHNVRPVTQIPNHWPFAYQELVQRRLEIISDDPIIGLLERPEYKRRWAHDSWRKMQDRALRSWLLDQLDCDKFWLNSENHSAARSVAELSDEVVHNADIMSALTLREGRPDAPVTEALTRLLMDESVPFLAAYRYEESGSRKRAEWEEVWAKQRREDAGEQIGAIQSPAKYASGDFREKTFAQVRGDLDIPAERFILYTDGGREGDSTALLGWGGWDHAQQSLALAAIIQEREQEGWNDERLIPLIAGLAELQPWVEQWHTEVISEYGASYAEICREELDQRAAQVGKTVAELAAWRPAAPVRGRKKAAKG